MRRNTLNFMVDLVTSLVMLAMVVTGLTIRFVLPPGSGGRQGGQGLALWGMGRHDWGSVHFGLTVVLAGLLVLHVALHWTWAWVTIRAIIWPQRTPETGAAACKRGLCGLGILVGLVALLGGFVWLAQSSVVTTVGEDGSGHGGRGRGFRGGRTRYVVPGERSRDPALLREPPDNHEAWQVKRLFGEQS